MVGPTLIESSAIQSTQLVGHYWKSLFPSLTSQFTWVTNIIKIQILDGYDFQSGLFGTHHVRLANGPHITGISRETQSSSAFLSRHFPGRSKVTASGNLKFCEGRNFPAESAFNSSNRFKSEGRQIPRNSGFPSLLFLDRSIDPSMEWSWCDLSDFPRWIAARISLNRVRTASIIPAFGDQKILVRDKKAYLACKKLGFCRVVLRNPPFWIIYCREVTSLLTKLMKRRAFQP